MVDRTAQVDYIERRGAEFRERFENRFAVYDETRFIEHYLKVNVCFGLRCITGEFKQCGFVFQHLPRGEQHSRMVSLSHQYQTVRIGRDGEQPFMLSDNVELMESPQEVIASIIRPERFKDSYVGNGKPMFRFDPVQWIGEVIEAGKDRKVRLSAGKLAIACGENASEQIKSWSKGIDDGADAGIDGGWQVALFAKYRDFLAGLRIRLCDRYTRIHLLPGCKHLPEQWEFGYAPVDRPYSV